MRLAGIASVALIGVLLALPVQAQLPEGYFVWSKGDVGDFASRKIYRLTLPDKTDQRALTAGEDVECQVSPDGRWVAYAKAILPDSDYHSFNRWSLYLVSIEGIHHGGVELEIDPSGYWPSWGGPDVLFYSRADGQHTEIVRVEIGADGSVTDSQVFLSTRDTFGGSIPEINECFVAPDGSWFAGRTRGISDSGVNGYVPSPPGFERLGWTGGSGCMPYVAPSGTWGFLAGSSSGVRWGDAPHVSNRTENAQLVAPKSGGQCYHPGISTDENWFMTGHSSSSDQNAGPWDISIYRLTGKSVSDEQVLVSGGFNGWPHLWVGSVAGCTDGQTRSCGTDTGECETGLETCQAGAWGSCSGEVGPGSEDCNDLDDDCDGQTDEDCDCTDGESRACGTDEGECTAGVQECLGGTWGAVCSGEVVAEAEECNSLDDDCDGLTDEDCQDGGSDGGADADGGTQSDGGEDADAGTTSDSQRPDGTADITILGGCACGPDHGGTRLPAALLVLIGLWLGRRRDQIE